MDTDTKTVAAMITTNKVSSKLTNRILPNKKLKRSTDSPPVKLKRRIPTARPEDNIIATAESDGICVECWSFVIPRAARIEATKAVQRG